MLSTLFECVFGYFCAIDLCCIVCVCVFGLLFLSLCSCLWRSSGWAPDCCSLLWHCPIEPKAVWLPLQAALSMATFHSHLSKHLILAYTCKHFLQSNQPAVFYSRYEHPRYLRWLNWTDPIGKCVCQSTPYVSVVGPVWFLGGVVLWCEWSGYSSFTPRISKLACVHMIWNAASPQPFFSEHECTAPVTTGTNPTVEGKNKGKKEKMGKVKINIFLSNMVTARRLCYIRIRTIDTLFILREMLLVKGLQLT